MEAVLTVRIDTQVKERGSKAMERCGFTPSQAVRMLFDYAAKNDRLPFPEREKPDAATVRDRVAAFDRCHTKTPFTLTETELRDARLKERYGSDD